MDDANDGATHSTSSCRVEGCGDTRCGSGNVDAGTVLRGGLTGSEHGVLSTCDKNKRGMASVWPERGDAAREGLTSGRADGCEVATRLKPVRAALSFSWLRTVADKSALSCWEEGLRLWWRLTRRLEAPGTAKNARLSAATAGAPLTIADNAASTSLRNVATS